MRHVYLLSLHDSVAFLDCMCFFYIWTLSVVLNDAGKNMPKEGTKVICA